MKKVILLVCGSLIFAASFGQVNFIWEKTDSIPMNKSQLYSATKMFIAEILNSSNEAFILNDDKEAGVILVKAFAYGLAEKADIYTFDYNVTFKMKDGKYKIMIDNVQCSSAIRGECIEPIDGNPYPKKLRGISNKRAVSMLADLKWNLQMIVHVYEVEVKKASSTNNNW
ncbi:MAG: DUF4468 domain-containing protein [Mariniphaga sp.]